MRMSTIKILHILSTPRAEGTPNLVLDWLDVPGPRQEVFVLHHVPANLTDELRGKAAWYDEDALFQGRGPRKFLGIVARIRRICRERRPDLVICWPLGLANWVAAGARLALGKRVLLLAHCGNPPRRTFRLDWLSRSVLWPLFLLGGRCVCCSDYVRDLFRSVPGIPDRTFETIYNCARVKSVRIRAAAARAAGGSLPGRRWGVMVATLERHKDHSTLLRALPAVLARCPDFGLRLVGEGSLRGELEALAETLGVRRAVEFLGVRRDVPEWLGRAELFVFSTTAQEGLGSVLLEALAAGLPIVASDVPACRETLEAGRYGQLVPPGNPGALARGILQALETGCDPAAVRSGQDYVSRFTPERMMEGYLRLAKLGPSI